MRIHLKARDPFRLEAVIRSHGWCVLAPFERNDDDTELRYVDRLPSGRAVAYSVVQADDGVVLQSPDEPESTDLEALLQRVAWMLDLDADLQPFHEIARDDPRLAHVADRAMGRVLRSPTLFEDMVKTILTTNTAWSGTVRMVRNVVRQWGTPTKADPQRHAFPTPEQLAAADSETLRKETGLGYRAPYVAELAQAVAEERLDLEAFKTSGAPAAELRRQLLAIKGVGPYAAANLLMLLGRYDYLPIDSWALRVVSLEWHEGAPVTPRDVEAAFEKWGPWKGLAYWFREWEHVKQ